MIPKTSETITKLAALNPELPPDKAEAKAKSIRQGLVVLLLGMILLALAVAIAAFPIYWLSEQPTVAFILLAALFAVPGLFTIVLGGFLMSQEAAKAAGGFFGVLASAANKVRK